MSQSGYEDRHPKNVISAVSLEQIGVEMAVMTDETVVDVLEGAEQVLVKVGEIVKVRLEYTRHESR